MGKRVLDNDDDDDNDSGKLFDSAFWLERGAPGRFLS